MGKHTVAEAEANFEEIIAEAERGEEVVITRDGHEVVRIEAVRAGHPQEADHSGSTRLAGKAAYRTRPNAQRRCRHLRLAHARRRVGALSVYLDTSVIVSLFINDSFSQRARSFMAAGPADILISDLASAEFVSALRTRCRMKLSNETEARAAFAAGGIHMPPALA